MLYICFRFCNACSIPYRFPWFYTHFLSHKGFCMNLFGCFSMFSEVEQKKSWILNLQWLPRAPLDDSQLLVVQHRMGLLIRQPVPDSHSWVPDAKEHQACKKYCNDVFCKIVIRTHVIYVCIYNMIIMIIMIVMIVMIIIYYSDVMITIIGNCEHCDSAARWPTWFESVCQLGEVFPFGFVQGQSAQKFRVFSISGFWKISEVQKVEGLSCFKVWTTLLQYTTWTFCLRGNGSNFLRYKFQVSRRWPVDRRPILKPSCCWWLEVVGCWLLVVGSDRFLGLAVQIRGLKCVKPVGLAWPKILSWNLPPILEVHHELALENGWAHGKLGIFLFPKCHWNPEFKKLWLPKRVSSEKLMASHFNFFFFIGFSIPLERRLCRAALPTTLPFTFRL